ncbi:hypothetical protein GGI10_006442, partial [Coemansia sp. RSA 2530]
MDSIPDIKARLLAVASEEGALPLGRKRLYALYQTLCETFPDEENDVVFPGEITVKEPVGAEERKIANKHKRKKEGKRRELKERTRAKADERKSLIAASAVQLDVNALEHEATADEERSYQEDLAKIRDMDRRAGVDSMGEDAASKTASKKAKRAAKKAQSNANGGDSSLDALADIPELVAIDSPATTAATDKGSNGCQGDEGGAWVVCNKDDSIAPKRKSVGKALPAEQFNESFVVQDKPKAPEGAKLSNGKRKIEGASSSLQGKQAAKDTVQSSDKKRLTWALERNSVKRFLKKVPMLPSPTQVSSTPDSDLKPALRKVSAYVDESP